MDEVWVELQNRLDRLEQEVRERVRPRLHELANLITAAQLISKEQGVLLGVLREDVSHLRDTTATRIQVDSGVQILTQRIENASAMNEQKLVAFHAENKLTIDRIKDQLDPMKKALYAAVGLLFTAVGLAILNLVLKGVK